MDDNYETKSPPVSESSLNPSQDASADRNNEDINPWRRTPRTASSPPRARRPSNEDGGSTSANTSLLNSWDDAVKTTMERDLSASLPGNQDPIPVLPSGKSVRRKFFRFGKRRALLALGLILFVGVAAAGAHRYFGKNDPVVATEQPEDDKTGAEAPDGSDVNKGGKVPAGTNSADDGVVAVKSPDEACRDHLDLDLAKVGVLKFGQSLDYDSVDPLWIGDVFDPTVAAVDVVRNIPVELYQTVGDGCTAAGTAQWRLVLPHVIDAGRVGTSDFDSVSRIKAYDQDLPLRLAIAKETARQFNNECVTAEYVPLTAEQTPFIYVAAYASSQELAYVAIKARASALFGATIGETSAGTTSTLMPFSDRQEVKPPEMNGLDDVIVVKIPLPALDAISEDERGLMTVRCSFGKHEGGDGIVVSDALTSPTLRTHVFLDRPWGARMIEWQPDDSEEESDKPCTGDDCPSGDQPADDGNEPCVGDDCLPDESTDGDKPCTGDDCPPGDSAGVDDGGSSQCVLPEGWTEMSVAQKVADNPCGCLDTTRIRADNGQCLPDVNDYQSTDGDKPCTGDDCPPGDQPTDGDQPCVGDDCPPGDQPADGDKPCTGDDCPPGDQPTGGDQPCTGNDCPGGESTDGDKPCTGDDCPPGNQPADDGNEPCTGDDCPPGDQPTDGDQPCVGDDCPPGDQPADGDKPCTGDDCPPGDQPTGGDQPCTGNDCPGGESTDGDKPCGDGCPGDQPTGGDQPCTGNDCPGGESTDGDKPCTGDECPGDEPTGGDQPCTGDDCPGDGDDQECPDGEFPDMDGDCKRDDPGVRNPDGGFAF